MALSKEEAAELQQLKDEEELAALQAEEQQASAAAPIETAPEGPSTGQAALLGAQKGATFGLDDEIAGKTEEFGNWLTMQMSGLDDTGKAEFRKQFIDGAYEKGRSEQKTSQEVAQEAHPWAHLAGGIAGGSLTAAVGGVAVKGAQAAGLSGVPLKAAQAVFSPTSLTAPKSLIRSGMLGGATNGAIAGAGESAEGGRLAGAAKGALIGTGAGLLFGTGAKLTRTAFRSVGRWLDPDALEAAAVGATKTDLKKGDGPGSVKAALKKFNELGGFSPDSSGEPISAEILQERAQRLLGESADEVSAILNQINDTAPRTSGDVFDLSDIDAILMRMDRNQVTTSQQNVAKEIGNLVGNFRKRFSQFADQGEGVSVKELQEFKQEIQSVIADGGGYEPGQMPGDLMNSMRSLADKVKVRIEKVADMSLPRDQAGRIKALNAAQSAALTLKPLIDGKAAQEAINGTKTVGALSNVVKLASAGTLNPDTTAGQIGRAQFSRGAQNLSAGLSRKADVLVTQLKERLPEIARMNPGLGTQISQVLKLPKNQMIPAMAPMMSMFGDYFEPAPYPSLLDGKLHDPADIESHREHIMQNVPSVSERAKQLSALNKDGTVAALPEQ